MRTRCSIFCSAAMLSFVTPALADSIVVDGVTHDDVVIRESDERYYVQNPADGSIFVVSKEDVSADDVMIDEGDKARNDLHREWRLERGLSEQTSFELQLEANREFLENPDAAIAAAASAAPAQREPTVIRNPNAGEVSDGRVPHVKLDDVPLGDALDAVLRPLGLDYRVEDSYVYVSTPDRLRHEPDAPLQRRNYQYTDMNATLPKVVVQNVGGQGAAGAGGFGGGAGGFGGGGAGGGGGAAGGFGGGGAGGAGGGGRGGGGGAQFSNISQLFGTFDDTLVGETPAVIGLGISGTGRGFER